MEEVEKINKFENLKAWQAAKDLAVVSYRLTKKFPKEEVFALVSQTTRAAVSIAANIAEGSSRRTKNDFSHFLEISLGSAFELKTLFDIALAQKYISDTDKKEIDQRIIGTVKLIYGLRRNLS